MFSLMGGVFLGWALGANDASNVIGPAVSTKMLRFRTAAVIAAIFVLTGALLQGRSGIRTLSGLTGMDLDQAVISSVAAAAAVTFMTILRLPVSSSQAVVGAILGIGVLNRQVSLSGLSKVVVCWLGTPVGGALAAILIYRAIALVYNRLNPSMAMSDGLIRVGILAAGVYGAWTLLAWTYTIEAVFGWSDSRDESIKRAFDLAQKTETIGEIYENSRVSENEVHFLPVSPISALSQCLCCIPIQESGRSSLPVAGQA